MTKTANATPAPALKLLVGVPAIEKALKSIFTRGQSLQADIHVAACSVLKHIGEHSDIRLANDLLAAMPEAARKNAMRDWLTKFGPILFEGDKAVFNRNGKVMLGDAMAKPFWKLVPEKPYEPLVIDKFVAAMIKKLEKDAKETKRDHSALINKISKITA
jgi:hypothetical protein